MSNTVHTTVRLPAELKTAVEKRAIVERRTITEIVVEGLKVYLARPLSVACPICTVTEPHEHKS